MGEVEDHTYYATYLSCHLAHSEINGGNLVAMATNQEGIFSKVEQTVHLS